MIQLPSHFLPKSLLEISVGVIVLLCGVSTPGTCLVPCGPSTGSAWLNVPNNPETIYGSRDEQGLQVGKGRTGFWLWSPVPFFHPTQTLHITFMQVQGITTGAKLSLQLPPVVLQGSSLLFWPENVRQQLPGHQTRCREVATEAWCPG